jgi:hypothetical protein
VGLPFDLFFTLTLLDGIDRIGEYYNAVISIVTSIFLVFSQATEAIERYR